MREAPRYYAILPGMRVRGGGSSDAEEAADNQATCTPEFDSVQGAIQMCRISTFYTSQPWSTQDPLTDSGEELTE